MQDVNCYLLDDEILANDRLERLLGLQSNIKIVGRKSCPEGAIKEIIRLRPDLVFVDVEMPRLSGFDVVEQLKLSGVKSTFIFVTGFEQYAVKAIRNEAFDFLVKPIDVDDLKAALERYKNKKATINIPSGWELSEREKEVLELVVKGRTSLQIAEELFLSKHTIDIHRRRLIEKSGCRNTSELIANIQ
ncbi:MAG: response regulator transcription factor [Carboxylicivirga sp.]|jgi:DNA-binding NarL/FixJ family response regulator|nr:response regulator transcription factor [Carboxylicivirga sp.]